MLQVAPNQNGGERSPQHEESEWSLTSSLSCNGTAWNVLSRDSVDRIFRDVIERAFQQNPDGAIPRDGSSDRSGGCPELRDNGTASSQTLTRPTRCRLPACIGDNEGTHLEM